METMSIHFPLHVYTHTIRDCAVKCAHIIRDSVSTLPGRGENSDLLELGGSLAEVSVEERLSDTTLCGLQGVKGSEATSSH